MARLPQPGGDNGTWGDVLNDYLSQVHKSDGTLKDNAVTANVLASNSVTNAAIATDAVTAASIADGSITEVLLSADVQSKLNSAGSATVADSTITTAKLHDDAVTDVKVASGAAIAQSKIANLTTDLAGKASASHTHTAAEIADSTPTGRAVLTAGDAAAARSAIGAGSSNLTLGTTSTTAAAGNDSRLSDTRTPSDNSVTTAKLADATVTEAKLSTDVQTKLNEPTPTWSTIDGKPTVIAAGADQAEARDALAMDIRYLRFKSQGSQFIRTMVEAPVTSETITLSASTTAPSDYSITKRFASGNTGYWSGFRVSGCPQVSTGGSTSLPRGATKTDATYGNWGGCCRVEFDLLGDGFVFSMQAIASSAYFKIWIDGKPHSLTAQACTSVSGVTAGSTNHFTVAFSTVAMRRITLEWSAAPASPSIHQGLRFKPIATVLPPSIPSPRFMVIHDSYGFGIGGVSAGDVVFNAYTIHLGRLLGFADIWNYTAVPSTGILKSDTPNAQGPYNTRFTTDVIPNLRSGDILLYSGSINDGSQADGATETQAIADLTTLKAALPDVKIIVSSDMYMATPTTSHLRIRTEVQSAATAVGLPFIDMLDTTLNVLNGTGYVGNATGTGNSDVNAENNNGIHPSLIGAKALAYFARNQIAPLLGQAA